MKKISSTILTLSVGLLLFATGCGPKSKGEIVFEQHGQNKEAYLINNSSSEIINFTVQKTNQVKNKLKYFVSKRSVLEVDSSVLTSTYQLAPGERKYLGNSKVIDTINLDKDPYDTYVPTADSTVPAGYIPPPKGINIVERQTNFKVVGAYAR